MAAGKSEDLGKLVLRLSIGFVLVLHGIFKLHAGVDWLNGPLSQFGLPGFLAYGVYIGEIVGPVLLILGFRARIGAAIVVLNMLVALALAHRAQIFTISPAGGGWAVELPALILFGALAIFFLGGGKYGIKGGKNAWD